MKESKTGIRIYEESDPLEGRTALERLCDAVNKLRVEINKIAAVLDKLTEVATDESKTEPESSGETH